MASNPTKTSNIEDKTDFWRIPGVNYRNGIYVVDLGKVLLNNGSSKTQDRWAEDSRKAIPKGEFHVGDFPLYHALFKALYERRTDHTTEEARRFISDNMVNSWLTTLTRVIHTPSGPDKVIHNYGLPDQHEVLEAMVGPDEFVKNTKTPAPYKALLGTDNTAEIQNVWSWLTGVDPFLWRVNSRPQEEVETVAGFGASAGGAMLSCDWYPQDSDAAVAVRVARSPS